MPLQKAQVAHLTSAAARARPALRVASSSRAVDGAVSGESSRSACDAVRRAATSWEIVSRPGGQRCWPRACAAISQGTYSASSEAPDDSVCFASQQPPSPVGWHFPLKPTCVQLSAVLRHSRVARALHLLCQGLQRCVGALHARVRSPGGERIRGRGCVSFRWGRHQPWLHAACTDQDPQEAAQSADQDAEVLRTSGAHLSSAGAASAYSSRRA